MFDTMVITKIVAGLCATLLFFLVGKWAADAIYLPSHGAGHALVVYPLPPAPVEVHEDAPATDAAATGTVAAAADQPAGEPDVMALYADADASAGETVWRNCRACHSLEAGRNSTGPSLHGVVGRPVDSVADFSYSGALLQVGDTWTVENLFNFLESPRNTAPGTRMTYAGLRNPQDRLNLIKYLESQGG